MKKLKYLIVGQGLAGSCLAWHLSQKTKDFLVVDDLSKESTSSISACIANPLTGKNLNLSYQAETIFPFAKNFYKTIEKELSTHFYHPRHILRYFINERQREVYREKSKLPEYEKYFGEANEKYVETLHSFFLRSDHFLESIRDWLKKQDSFLNAKFSAKDLVETNSNWQWQNLSFEKVIFCNGYQANNFELTNHLKFRLARGEILDLEIPALGEDRIINFGKFLLPLGNNRYRLGATYSWDNFKDPPSESAKQELINAMQKFFDFDFKILKQVAGVRPIVHGNIPVYGKHPDIDNCYFLNGLGSKGVLYGPYYSKLLSETLLSCSK